MLSEFFKNLIVILSSYGVVFYVFLWRLLIPEAMTIVFIIVSYRSGGFIFTWELYARLEFILT